MLLGGPPLPLFVAGRETAMENFEQRAMGTRVGNSIIGYRREQEPYVQIYYKGRKYALLDQGLMAGVDPSPIYLMGRDDKSRSLSLFTKLLLR